MNVPIRKPIMLKNRSQILSGLKIVRPGDYLHLGVPSLRAPPAAEISRVLGFGDQSFAYRLCVGVVDLAKTDSWRLGETETNSDEKEYFAFCLARKWKTDEFVTSTNKLVIVLHESKLFSLHYGIVSTRSGGNYDWTVEVMDEETSTYFMKHAGCDMSTLGNLAR